MAWLGIDRKGGEENLFSLLIFFGGGVGLSSSTSICGRLMEA